MQYSDWEQLAYAARERRSLVTRNGRHFLLLAHDAVRRQEPHSGIIICPPSTGGSEISEIVARLRLTKRCPEGLGGYDVIYL